MHILYNPVGSCATSCQRLIYPLMGLQNTKAATVEVINTNDIRAQLRSADLVVLQCVIGPEQHELVDYIQGQGKKVVIDYDDLMSRLPDRLLTNLGMEQDSITENWTKYLQTADAITVPTEALATRIREHTNKPVYVIPNYLPKHEYMFSSNYVPADDGEIRILYSCSESHWDDFQYIGSLLREFGEAHPNVTIYSQGGLEFGYHFWEFKGKTLHEPKTSYGSYYSMLRRVQPHIFIAPLLENEHNLCRSDLKYLQAGIVKAAFVGSFFRDVADQPYSKVVNNVTGFTVTKKTEWWSTLKQLVENPNLIKSVGSKAYEEMADHLLEDHLNEWSAIYTEVLK